jgi:hypothetical protein
MGDNPTLLAARRSYATDVKLMNSAVCQQLAQLCERSRISLEGVATRTTADPGSLTGAYSEG